MKDYVVSSFSGGKDSTAMTWRWIEEGNQLDEIVFCDTGKEFPEMDSHIENQFKLFREMGIKCTTLKAKKTFDHYQSEHIVKHRDGTTSKGYGWARMGSRWCTTLLKVGIMTSYINKIAKHFNVIELHRIAYDEQNRIGNNIDSRKSTIKYPLNEWKMVEAECLKFCYDSGWDWNGLYVIFDRVSCWCCPLKSEKEILALKKHKPKLYKKLLQMDVKSRLTFKIGKELKDIKEKNEQLTLF